MMESLNWSIQVPSSIPDIGKCLILVWHGDVFENKRGCSSLLSPKEHLKMWGMSCEFSWMDLKINSSEILSLLQPHYFLDNNTSFLKHSPIPLIPISCTPHWTSFLRKLLSQSDVISSCSHQVMETGRYEWAFMGDFVAERYIYKIRDFLEDIILQEWKYSSSLMNS